MNLNNSNKTFCTPTHIIEINGHQAVIKYDKDIKMFRGEFITLKGYADFYAKDLNSLLKEGVQSLKIYFEMYHELV